MPYWKLNTKPKHSTLTGSFYICLYTCIRWMHSFLSWSFVYSIFDWIVHLSPSPSLLFADPPISPRGLDLVIITSPTPTLRLVWERPLNVDPQVDIVYTVEINSTLPDGINYGPFENISQTYLPIDFPEALHSNRSCQMYRFFVSARNGAGPSLPSSYIETLPISKSFVYMS